MAIAAVDTNHLAQWALRNDWRLSGHTGIFEPLDNMWIGWGLVRDGEIVSPEEPFDPYDGWYHEEKQNYISNNGKQTGHYTQLVGNHYNTGLALSKSVERADEYNADRMYFTFNQNFS